MTYATLNTVFLGLTLWFVVIAWIVLGRRDGLRVRQVWPQWAVTAGVLLLGTAVFDNLIIAVHLVAYNPSTLTGIYLGLVPIEDFAYTVAAVAALPTLWLLLGGRRENS
jgi:small toxic polypeptide LdrA/B/C/D